MAEVEILAGTSKGLVRIERGRGGVWKIREVFFGGMPASMFFEDDRTQTWWTGLSHRHWGAKLHYSGDRGKTWKQVAAPVFPTGERLPNGKPASLRKLWCMQKAGGDNATGLWLGVEPGALFYSGGRNSDFQLVDGLWHHPSRKDPQQWFGAGRDYSFIHTIEIDPLDSGHIYIAVSCAGVFESRDNGKSWEPRNQGLVAAYLPNPEVEVGHDPHAMLICKNHPDVMWQQNHCGIFRSTDGARSWQNVSEQDGIANYGFALAIDHDDPLRAWVVPAVSDEQRVAADLQLTVCRTEDGGKTWNALRNGLPGEFCFDIAFRDSFDRKGATMAFGTSNGNIYVSEDDGEMWQTVTTNLSRVESLAIITTEN